MKSKTCATITGCAVAGTLLIIAGTVDWGPVEKKDIPPSVNKTMRALVWPARFAVDTMTYPSPTPRRLRFYVGLFEKMMGLAAMLLFYGLLFRWGYVAAAWLLRKRGARRAPRT